MKTKTWNRAHNRTIKKKKRKKKKTQKHTQTHMRPCTPSHRQTTHEIHNSDRFDIIIISTHTFQVPMLAWVSLVFLHRFNAQHQISKETWIRAEIRFCGTIFISFFLIRCVCSQIALLIFFLHSISDTSC